MIMNTFDQKAVDLAVANLEKQFGKNTIIHGSSTPDEVEVISTGNFRLDLALGVGGLPKGRITEIFGGEGLGKSLIATSLAAQCQAAGGHVAYIDAECDLNPEWAEKLGVDIDALYIAQPETGEEAFEIVDSLLNTKSFDLIIVDSVAALTPRVELEGAMEDQQMGLQARMMAKGLRKTRHAVMESNTCMVYINQIRDKIGFMQCLHGDTIIPLTDGTHKTIREIVENKLEVEVYAFDEFKPVDQIYGLKKAKVIDWHVNENAEQTPFLSIDALTADGPVNFIATTDHKVLTLKGWKPAEELKIGDFLISKYTRPNEKWSLYYSKITDIKPYETQDMKKYDLTIDTYHNYLAGGFTNGCIVHNSGTTSPGGRALKFYSSVRIELKKMESLKDNKTGESTGTRIKAFILKNKVGRPMRTVEYDVLHGIGFNNFGSILELAVKHGLIIKKGAYYYRLGEEKTFAQGEANAIEYLASDLEWTNWLKEEIEKNV